MSISSKQSWLASSIALGLAIVVGCDQPGGPARPQTRAPGLVGVNTDIDVENVAPVQAPTPPPAEPKPQSIIGQKTQDIGDTESARKAGAAPAPRQLSKDPVRVYGNAYVSIVGQASIGQIKHTVDLYQAETGEYPKTHEEFMEKIIKANNIALPVLPRNRKYVYDVATHELGVWEYPEAQN
jgi:hypothetical protein